MKCETILVPRITVLVEWCPDIWGVDDEEALGDELLHLPGVIETLVYTGYVQVTCEFFILTPDNLDTVFNRAKGQVEAIVDRHLIGI